MDRKEKEARCMAAPRKTKFDGYCIVYGRTVAGCDDCAFSYLTRHELGRAGDDNMTKEMDLIEHVAQAIYADAINDIKELLQATGFETNEPKYDDLDNTRKAILRAKAMRLIATVRRADHKAQETRR